MNIINRIIRRLVYPHSYNNDVFVNYLRGGGITIGKNCIFYSPNTVRIDVQRPWMLKIGDYVKITSGVTILCHDYSRSVLIQYFHDNVGEAKETIIGDNVFIGMNAIILMGTHIGDNSIVGAGAVCSGIYPDNSVIAGNPAKVVMSLEEFYHKRKQRMLENAVLYAKKFKENKNRYPSEIEMTNAFSWLYLPREKETFERYPKLFKLNGVDSTRYKEDFMESKSLFASFKEFILFVEKKES